MFQDSYVLPSEREQRFLGQGGASVVTERCIAMATGNSFAAKRLSRGQDYYLVENEFFGLSQAKRRFIPRVVRLEDLTNCRTGDPILILELIKGTSLYKALAGPYAALGLKQREQHVLKVAAELLQTIQSLHSVGTLCHLDVSSSNIMLRSDNFKPWDQLRLIDFGFAQKVRSADPLVRDIAPQGATPVYAAPEVLKSLQLQFEAAAADDVGVNINGPSADFWSVGVVLFELLTGELPFDSKDRSVAAPSRVATRHQSRWQSFEAVRQLQQTWIDACSLAQATSSEVQHPLLDKVRQCSANPEQASLFFQQILSPVPHLRRQAMHHKWCAATVQRMFKQTKTDYPPDDASDLYYYDFEIGCVRSACADVVEFLDRCLPPACGGSPRVLEDQPPLPRPQTRQGPKPGKKGPLTRIKSCVLYCKASLPKVKSLFSRRPKATATKGASGGVAVSAEALGLSGNQSANPALDAVLQPSQHPSPHNASYPSGSDAAVMTPATLPNHMLLLQQPVVCSQQSHDSVNEPAPLNTSHPNSSNAAVVMTALSAHDLLQPQPMHCQHTQVDSCQSQNNGDQDATVDAWHGSVSDAAFVKPTVVAACDDMQLQPSAYHLQTQASSCHFHHSSGDHQALSQAEPQGAACAETPLYSPTAIESGVIRPKPKLPGLKRLVQRGKKTLSKLLHTGCA